MKKRLILASAFMIISMILISLIFGISDSKPYDYSKCMRSCNEYKKIDQKSCIQDYLSKISQSRIDYKSCLKTSKVFKECLKIYNLNNKAINNYKKNCQNEVNDNFINCKDSCLNSGDICSKEGETIPVVLNSPVCCENLILIPPKQEFIVGISGICTSKCGNGICDNETESVFNCEEDCNNTEIKMTCVQCGEKCITNTKNIICPMYISNDFECKIINNSCEKVAKNDFICYSDSDCNLVFSNCNCKNSCFHKNFPIQTCNNYCFVDDIDESIKSCKCQDNQCVGYN